MKSLKRVLVVLFLIVTISIPDKGLFAQAPPPPQNGHNSNTNEAPPGGGAPLGGGAFILMGLAAVYGTKKLKNSRLI